MQNLEQGKHKKNGSELPQIFAILASSLVGLFDGMLFAWTSPSIPALVVDESKNISLEQASYFTIINPISMAITSPLFSILIDVIGRRLGVLLVAVPGILAWILIILNGNIWMYYGFRVLVGIVDAGLYATVPVYVCEIAQPKVRGNWGNLATASIYMGMFLINVIGSYNSIFVTAIISAPIPIIHILLFLFMPESPYYLLMKDEEEEARKCLQKLRQLDDVGDELATLKQDVQRQLSETGSMKDLVVVSSNRKAFLICTLVRLAQQLSGLAAFEMYTQYMFKEAGTDISEKTSAIVFTGILFIAVSSSVYFVERLGRRPLLITSCTGTGVSLGILSIYLYISERTEINLIDYKWVPLTAMSIYVVFFAPGIGLLPTLMLGELFSSSIKAKAVSVANVITAVCFLIVPKFFQSTTNAYGLFAPFAVFSISCFIIAVLLYAFVIETKGKTLEEIQLELKGHKPV